MKVGVDTAENGPKTKVCINELLVLESTPHLSIPHLGGLGPADGRGQRLLARELPPEAARVRLRHRLTLGSMQGIQAL